MPLQLITPPTAEPIHLTDALAHINQATAIDDAHVLATIVAARKNAEKRTWRQLIGARFNQVLDSFPGIGQTGVPWGRTFGIPSNAILLERLPVQVVEGIQYLDMSGTLQTVDPAIYTVDTTSEPCRIAPKFGQIWPIPLPQIGAVIVTFVAGFAAPFSVVANNPNITLSGAWKTLSIGDAVRFSNSGDALPTPLSIATDYYIVSNPSPGVYTVSATKGGSPITPTTTGDGLNFIGEVPGDILAWMRLRIGSYDQFREEAIAMNRGKIEDLPFVDALLDSYATWF